MSSYQALIKEEIEDENRLFQRCDVCRFDSTKKVSLE